MAPTSSLAHLERGILAGDPKSIARGATLVENRTDAGRALIASLFPKTGRAMILGITGPPGAGKSTLVARLATCFRRTGRSVGVIAVDPSSPYSRGAVLGDRIRMQIHHDDPGVFVRSMSTRGKLGGLAAGTLDLVLLLDAAGLNVVLVETVGVGQDEVDVARITDLTLLVLPPGLGDDVQAMKAGMMEIASIFVVNKADLPNAQQVENEIRFMQSLSEGDRDGSNAPVHLVSALDGTGIEALVATIDSEFRNTATRERRTESWALRLRELLREHLFALIPDELLERHAIQVSAQQEDPYAAIESLAGELMGKGLPERG